MKPFLAFSLVSVLCFITCGGALWLGSKGCAFTFGFAFVLFGLMAFYAWLDRFSEDENPEDFD